MVDLTSLEAGSPISYAIAFVLPALDAIIPVVPSEAVIVALGVTSVYTGDPRIGLLVACTAAGAFAGDNGSYLLGRRFGPAVERRFFSSGRAARQRAWAERALQRFGTQIIVVCRFIPGGRTAVTLTCGLVGYSWRRFAAATAVAACIWSAYAFLLGRLGGKAFESQPLLGFAVALGGSAVISGLIEVGRRLYSYLSGRRSVATRYEPISPETPAGAGAEPETGAGAGLCEPTTAACPVPAEDPADASPVEDAEQRPGASLVRASRGRWRCGPPPPGCARLPW